MSDKKTKSVDDKTSEYANSTDEYTMKDILESNVYARRIDRQKGLPVRPLEVWNIVDSNVSRDQVRHNRVKMAKNTPSSEVGPIDGTSGDNMSKDTHSTEVAEKEGSTLIKMTKHNLSSKVTKKEDKSTIGEKISTLENKLKVDKDSVEKEVASSNINEESETNVDDDLTTNNTSPAVVACEKSSSTLGPVWWLIIGNVFVRYQMMWM